MSGSKVQLENFKVNKKTMREILSSPDMLNAVVAIANDIAAAAGPGFEVNSRIGRNRARASVRTETREARYEEAVNRRLSKAIEAGRR